jgi:hypothetical protein
MTESTSAGAAAAPAAEAIDAAILRRSKRRRTLFILAGISVGWKLLVFTVGAALPHWLLTDGVAELPASDRPYATASLATARALYDTRLERLVGVVRRVRVVSVDSVTRDAADAAGAAPCAIGARVRAYTYFAIPYSEVRTRCGRGVIEYRLFRPRTRAE